MGSQENGIQKQVELGVSSSSMKLASLFWQRVAEQPDAVALHEVDEHRQDSYSWSGIANYVVKWVEKLEIEESGGRIASYLPNSIDWIALDLACQTIGMVHVAIDRKLPPLEAERMAAFCECSLLVSERDVFSSEGYRDFDAQSLKQRADAVGGHSAALALFTSGSTGSPKAVVHSHDGLLANAHAKLNAAPQRPFDVRANVLPFTHAYARTCELSTWLIAGGELVLFDSFKTLVKKGKQFRPTLINLVPYLAEKLADLLATDHQALGNDLRLLQVGGAALPESLWDSLKALGLPPLQGYGLTETGPVVCSNRAGSQRPGVVGPPVDGVAVRFDSSGQLWVSGPSLMLGYLNAEAETQTVIQDGWLATGDLAEETADGIRITGRIKQQLSLSTGQQVSPEPIEARIGELESVRRVLVFGQDRPHVAAIIWIDGEEPQDSSELLNSLREQIGEVCRDFPRYAIPEQLVLTSDETPNVGNALANHKGQLRRSDILKKYALEVSQLAKG